MSWKDRIENVQLTITTGDEKIYKPLWKNSSKSKSYNATAYNFIGVEGTFVDRKKPQGGKFPLVLWFQGEDNIDVATAFEISAADSRPWKVKHPFYGNIIGQPVSLERDDSNYNVTQITIDFWESIGDEFPNTESSTKEIVKSKTETVSQDAAENYSIKVDPTPSDGRTLQESAAQIAGSFKRVLNETNFSEYQLAVNKTLKSANNIVSSPLAAISDIQQLTLLPSLYSSGVSSRIDSLLGAYSSLGGIIDNKPTKNDKLYYESNGATTIAAMCQASVEPTESDYITATEIERLSVQLTTTLEDYLLNLDGLQVNVGESLDVFIPNDSIQTGLYDLVSEATANLFKLAFNAKQERKVIVKRGTNLILLTHKYVGLDLDDQNLEDFRLLNNIKNDELFFIKKDRIIKYFV